MLHTRVFGSRLLDVVQRDLFTDIHHVFIWTQGTCVVH